MADVDNCLISHTIAWLPIVTAVQPPGRYGFQFGDDSAVSDFKRNLKEMVVGSMVDFLYQNLKLSIELDGTIWEQVLRSLAPDGQLTAYHHRGLAAYGYATDRLHLEELWKSSMLDVLGDDN